MLEAERQLSIINIIRRNGSVQIAKLSELLGVSQNTIRRDLKKLEVEGFLRRTYGGAISADSRGIERPTFIREDEYREEKERIGLKAAEMIEDSDTIIIDTGTTTMQVAKNLKGKRDLTVITNSIRIADELADNLGAVIILTGGIVRPNTRCLVGSQAEQFVVNQISNVSKAFIGISGIDVEKGLTNQNPFEVQIKRAILEKAKKAIIVAASNKFGYVDSFPVGPLNLADVIVTDDKISQDYLEAIKAMGIEVIIA